MRKYEKIITIILGVIILLQFFPNYPLKALTLFSATWLVAFSYILGGFWLLNNEKDRKFLLPISTGIAFGISLFSLPFLLHLNFDDFYYFSPIPNLIVFIVLSINAIKNRKTNNNSVYIKNILLRSILILFVSSFFTYTPHSIKPFRHILMALNNGNERLVNNLLMFDYVEEYEKSLKKGDCDKAIMFALKANNAAKIWKEIIDEELQNPDPSNIPFDILRNDSNLKLSPEIEEKIKNFTKNGILNQISPTYTNLYRAYKCKGNAEYDNKNFSVAMLNYKIAYKYLDIFDGLSKYWDKEKSTALENIAFCYKELNNYPLADSFFVSAITNYIKVVKTPDSDLAYLYSNLASSLSDELQFSDSKTCYLAAISILYKDTSNSDNRKDLESNYNGLAKNYLMQDSLESSLFYLKKAMKFSRKIEESGCTTKLYYGLCLYKLNKYLSADSVLKNSLECFKITSKKNTQNIAECYLALSYVNIALARYDDARKFINTGIDITLKNYSSSTSRYARYLYALAYLNQIIGNYNMSEKQYQQAIEIFDRELGRHNNTLPQVFCGYAHLELILSKFKDAKEYSDSSIGMASSFFKFNNPSTNELLNGAAYTNYSLGIYKPADTLYKKVIRISNNFNREFDLTKAIALNGLGLVETYRKNNKKAESYFQQSIELHLKILSNENPLTAVVYLNYGILLIQEGKLLEAEEIINKSLVINKQFFKSDHDIFADIYVAKGDLFKKKMNDNIAKDFYNKGLDIYKKKFNDQHWKVIATLQKIN